MRRSPIMACMPRTWATPFLAGGAFLTPLAVAALVRRTGFAPGLVVLAVFALVFGLLALGYALARPFADKAAGPTAVAQGGLFLGQSVPWLCALALFFYLPLEATMAAWFTTYSGRQRRQKEARLRTAVGLLVGVHDFSAGGGIQRVSSAAGERSGRHPDRLAGRNRNVDRRSDGTRSPAGGHAGGSGGPGLGPRPSTL